MDRDDSIKSVIEGVQALIAQRQEHLAAAASIEAVLASLVKDLRSLGIEDIAALPARLDGRTREARLARMLTAAREPICIEAAE